MVFECPYPASILDRDNRGYCSAYPSWTLAFFIDIPRVYSDRDSNSVFGMARKNVDLRRLPFPSTVLLELCRFSAVLTYVSPEPEACLTSSSRLN
jgi:hypothetical protein